MLYSERAFMVTKIIDQFLLIEYQKLSLLCFPLLCSVIG